MIVYDNGDRLQHKDSAAAEQTVATWEDLGYAYADLREAYTVPASWSGGVRVPIKLVSAQGATLTGDVIRLTRPGVWFVNAQANANAHNVEGTLYVLLGGTYSGGSNYAGYYLDGSGRRFGAPTHSMVISDGTATTFMQAQVTRVSGTAWPVINAVNFQCHLVHPMSADAARALLATLPPTLEPRREDS